MTIASHNEERWTNRATLWKWKDDCDESVKVEDTEDSRGNDLKGNGTWTRNNQTQWTTLGEDFATLHETQTNFHHEHNNCDRHKQQLVRLLRHHQKTRSRFARRMPTVELPHRQRKRVVHNISLWSNRSTKFRNCSLRNSVSCPHSCIEKRTSTLKCVPVQASSGSCAMDKGSRDGNFSRRS